MIPLTRDTFSEYISKDTPVLVKFYATWCAPCMKLGEIFHRLETPFEHKVTFGKLDVDSERELVKELGVRSVPTFFLYQNGKILEQWSGVKTIAEMSEILGKHVT
mgnify:CR=1 FL=1